MVSEFAIEPCGDHLGGSALGASDDGNDSYIVLESYI